MIKRWDLIESRQQGDYGIFRVRADRRRSPRSGQEHTFYVIESGDWINIIPITSDGKIVFIKQYRHGTQEFTLEIPGGMIDSGESGEEAARREMREETAFDSKNIAYLGSVAPNPAIHNNICHSYLARDVCPLGSQRLDDTEDIEVSLVNPRDVPGLIVGGTISHALVVTAFYLYEHNPGGVKHGG